MIPIMDKLITAHIVKTAQLLKNTVTSDLKKNGHKVTSEQWKVLNIIDEYKSITQVSLGRELYKAAPAISKVVSKLNKMNLINIDQSKTDKREKILTLSPEGNEIITKINSCARKTLLAALKDVTQDECEQITQILNKIKENLENHE